MSTARTIFGMALAATAILLLSFVSPGFGKDGEQPAHPASKAVESNGNQAPMPMMVHMKNMNRIKATLEEAKGAAEAEGAKTALARINDTLKLLEQDHQFMHQHMTRMMEKMKQCMRGMQDMERSMKSMKEEMGKHKQTKPMQPKMEAMQKKMRKMQKQMGGEADEGPMKCPMCKKMMAGKSKSSTKPAG